MPNTTIQLKKSSTPSAKPADLANGELAINFADGKLFYKNTANYIAEFSSGGYSFGTVNANSTLLVADTTGDVLTIVPGNNITVVGDAINDKVTIGLADSVGIGTSIPAANLHVVGSVITGKLQHSPVEISRILTGFDSANSDFFSFCALSEDGSVLAVSSRNWEGATGTNRGGVYIYDWNGSNWIQRGSVLEAADAADIDGFGSAVSLNSNGSILAVGAQSWEGATGTDRGGVYIYDWNGSAWVQRGSVLEAADAADSDSFSKLALSSNGSILAVGASAWEGATGTGRGGVYIYDWNGSAWLQRGSVLEAADAADSDGFGSAVSLSGDGSVMAVGSFSWEGAVGTNRGGVYIYDWNGSNWLQRGSVLEAADAADSDNFVSVSLAKNGSILVVGSSNWEGATGTNRGAVYTYTLDGTMPGRSSVATGSGWIEGANSALIARTAGLDRITVDVNGKVGIGNTAPISRLTVDTGISVTANELLYALPYFELYRSGQSHWKLQHLSNGLGIQNSWSGQTYRSALVMDDGLGISTQEILRLAYFGGIGAIGIGISAPTAKLTVANGTSPTSQHNYGTYTDASNYERINLTANSSGHYIIGEKAGTGSARPLYLGANNTTVVTVNSDKSVVVKDKLYGRSSIDHVTYSIFEASIDSVYIANDSSRSGIGYPISTLYIGGLADGRDAFRLNSNTIYLGAKTTVFRTQANPNTTNWVSGGSFSVTSNPGSDNFAFGIDDNRTYGWLQYWSSGTATNISINPLGGNVGIGTTSPSSRLTVNGGITGNNFNSSLSTNVASPSFAMGTTGIWSRNNSVRLNFAINGAESGVEVGTNLVALASTAYISWTSGTLASSNPDLFLQRDAANTLAQRNGTIAQTYRIYGTYTDVSNYERLSLSANSSGHYIIGEEAGTGSARPLYLGANNATAVTIDTAGKVGIGTTSPTSLLHVSANSARLTIQQSIAGSFFSGIDFASYVGGVGGTLGGLIFNQNSGEIRLNAAATYFPTIYSNGTEIVRITTAGNVGIGITSPAYKLEVAGPASFPYNIASFTDGTTRGITLKTSTNGYTNMRLFDGGGRNITITSQPNDLTTADNYLAAIAQGIGSGVSLSTATNIDSQHMTLRARGDIVFYTNLGSTSLLERMRVAADGNIGINTTLPTEKLQVEGNAIINGNLAIGTTTNYNCVFKLNNDIEIATNKVAATNANTQTVISTFSADKYRGGKFTILGKNANDSHITELLLTHNFTNVFYTEYGVVYSNTSLYTVSSSIVSNNVQIVLNSALPDIHYDIMENKFVDIGVYDRSQTITLDRSGSIIEIRAA